MISEAAVDFHNILQSSWSGTYHLSPEVSPADPCYEEASRFPLDLGGGR